MNWKNFSPSPAQVENEEAQRRCVEKQLQELQQQLELEQAKVEQMSADKEALETKLLAGAELVVGKWKGGCFS